MPKKIIAHRIDGELLAALEKQAKKENRTRSNMLESILAKALNVKPKP